jgi:outer membrane protein assembly factor BamB
MTLSALTTGGGLVFVGDSDRCLYAHDVATGKVLFQVRVAGIPTGSPIAYAVRGKEYFGGSGRWQTKLSLCVQPAGSGCPSGALGIEAVILSNTA